MKLLDIIMYLSPKANFSPTANQLVSSSDGQYMRTFHFQLDFTNLWAWHSLAEPKLELYAQM